MGFHGDSHAGFMVILWDYNGFQVEVATKTI